MDARKLIGVDKVVAEEEIREHVDGNPAFSRFLTKCIHDFVNLVIMKRGIDEEIAQDYMVPLDIEDMGGDMIMLTRKEDGSEIFVDRCRW